MTVSRPHPVLGGTLPYPPPMDPLLRELALEATKATADAVAANVALRAAVNKVLQDPTLPPDVARLASAAMETADRTLHLAQLSDGLLDGLLVARARVLDLELAAARERDAERALSRLLPSYAAEARLAASERRTGR